MATSWDWYTWSSSQPFFRCFCCQNKYFTHSSTSIQQPWWKRTRLDDPSGNKNNLTIKWWLACRMDGWCMLVCRRYTASSTRTHLIAVFLISFNVLFFLLLLNIHDERGRAWIPVVSRIIPIWSDDQHVEWMQNVCVLEIHSLINNNTCLLNLLHCAVLLAATPHPSVAKYLTSKGQQVKMVSTCCPTVPLSHLSKRMEGQAKIQFSDVRKLDFCLAFQPSY